MTLSDYSRPPRIARFPEFAARLGRLSNLVALENLSNAARGPATKEDILAFGNILRMQTRAHRDAPAKPGRFPVVVYHPGARGSFDENIVLCEFLASHGYVVVSSAYQTNTVHVANDQDQTPRSIRDMQFLLQTLSRLPSADVARSAAIGHSFGAQTLFHWIGEADCPLNAMVSLDSTLEYTPRDFPGHKELRDTLEALRKPVIPVLLFASAARSPNFRGFDAFLQRAPVYEAAVPNLRHNDYISQGVVRALFPHTAPVEDKESVQKMRRSYDDVCRTILRFLDLVLGSGERARTARDQLSSGGLNVRYRAPVQETRP